MADIEYEDYNYYDDDDDLGKLRLSLTKSMKGSLKRNFDGF